MESSVRLDHLATLNEVREALASVSRDAFELVRAPGTHVGLEVDVSNGVATLSEELAWLRAAYAVLDPRPN